MLVPFSKTCISCTELMLLAWTEHTWHLRVNGEQCNFIYEVISINTYEIRNSIFLGSAETPNWRQYLLLYNFKSIYKGPPEMCVVIQPGSRTPLMKQTWLLHKALECRLMRSIAIHKQPSSAQLVQWTTVNRTIS